MNHITIELCTEDRQRLDRIISAMERGTGHEATAAPEAPGIVEPIVDEAAVVPEAEPVEDIPLAQIQKKVAELCSVGKKARVRDIILEFGAKVTDLTTPELRRAAWDKLGAL